MGTEYTKLLCALKRSVSVNISQRGLGKLCPGLLKPWDLDEPSLIKRRDVPGVDGRCYCLPVSVTRRSGMEERTSSSYTIAGTLLLINTLEGWILTCCVVSVARNWRQDGSSPGFPLSGGMSHPPGSPRCS